MNKGSMTTNHLAHGPVSLDRLHQIREHLLHDTQYSNGGNRAYILADVLKVIDVAIAAFGAEPAPLQLPVQHWEELCRQNPDMSIGDAIIRAAWWNHCAATLQAGNSPVTSYGWIPVSERMPERDVDVQVYCVDKKEQMVGYMERNEAEGWFRFASLPNGVGVYCKPTHWMPLPAAPQQEVK